ncbi:MAG TPA: type IV toxin-antitoxin system AbiEi family antitoxin [Phycisphaerae bacterium]|nr:type IV toxin-antitoxin system AbiEi family antitoxin [Phycisphaerae bacterium]
METTSQTPAQPTLRLIQALASEGDRIITMDRARALAPAAGISSGYLRQALHHLTKTGWLVRLRQGLYALAASVPGVFSAHEFEIAMALVPEGAISHWSALHYHGLTEQAPRKVFVLTTLGTAIPRTQRAPASQGGLAVGGTIYQFIRVKPQRYFGTQKIWVGQARITMTDPERTLLDGLMMPQYCGDFAEVLHAFAARADRLDVSRIIDYALKLDAATAKRLGWVLQQQGVDERRLEKLARVPVKGYRTLDPSGPRRGPCDRRWMIQENLPGKVTP